MPPPRRRGSGWHKRRAGHDPRTCCAAIGGCRPPARCCASSIRASRPLTWAAAYEAPDTIAQRESGRHAGMSVPGAATMPPCSPALSSTTATTPAMPAGKPPLGAPRSAAATTLIPAATRPRPARADGGPTARSGSCLMTWAPRSIAACRPSARLSVVHRVSVGAACQHERKASTRACGATPTMPVWLSARAAMMPATAVP